jgi:hypothetical protein
MTKIREREMMRKCTTDNGRFGTMAGVAPHKRQCNFGSSAPARASVNPPLRQAATTLAVMRDSLQGYLGGL